MKTTRIEVQGAKGKAAIRREGDEVVIEATVGRKTTTWRFFSRIHEDQVAMARRLQQTLDGYLSLPKMPSGLGSGAICAERGALRRTRCWGHAADLPGRALRGGISHG